MATSTDQVLSKATADHLAPAGSRACASTQVDHSTIDAPEVEPAKSFACQDRGPGENTARAREDKERTVEGHPRLQAVCRGTLGSNPYTVRRLSKSLSSAFLKFQWKLTAWGLDTGSKGKYLRANWMIGVCTCEDKDRRNDYDIAGSATQTFRIRRPF